MTTQTKLIHLPEKYDLVVGDTFELFYKGIMLCKNPYSYNILVNCSIGKAWGRKFEATPTEAGTYPLTVTVSDDFGNVIDKAGTNLVVKEKMTSPKNAVNVLCIGDSLTLGGEWVDEVFRRLTNTNSVTGRNHKAPTGEGLTNINFIGKQKTVNGAGYEGKGGWRFTHYTSTDSATSNFWVTCTHSKTDDDQESIYLDNNGVQWQLETIEKKRLKFKPYGVDTVEMPSGGTLTHVSGGKDTGSIIFTSSEPENGNPFVYNGKVDFESYCESLGISTIDICYILLGWNNAGADMDVYKEQVKALLDLLIKFNKGIKITLMGLQMPSLDGLAQNYGAAGIYANYRALQEYVFAVDELYAEIAGEYPDNVDFLNISGQFDTEYNMQTMETAVNARNEATIRIGSNGVHPGVFGYYQIADAVYRHFNNN